jgi:HlyD family type I secretion membrane fusion protein
MNKNQRNYEQLHQISTAALLEESSHLRLVMQGIIVTGFFVVALIVWAAFSSVQETAVTFGEVIPKGKIQVIQHLEGGIVSHVYVNNGDEVKQGQVLLKMDPAAVQAELSQLRANEISLVLDNERLRAFIGNKQAQAAQWSSAVINSKYNTVKNSEEIKSLLSDEQAHLAAQYKTYSDQLQILKSALQKKLELKKELQAQTKVMDRHVSLLTEEFEMYHKLKEKNYVSHRDYLVVVRELNKAKGERTRLDGELAQTEEDLKESEFKIKELYSAAQEKARKELGMVEDRLIELRHRIEKTEDQLQRLTIKAPVHGIVKGIAVFPGNVVQPGGQLLEVVPTGSVMLVESRVKPRDIGFIKVGDMVKVKVLTYDFARYGAIEGKLANISASTYNDEEGKPYYRATISLDKQYLGNDSNKKYVKPGMTVQADVVTGEKTILQYLLKPIHRARDAAFSER